VKLYLYPRICRIVFVLHYNCKNIDTLPLTPHVYVCRRGLHGREQQDIACLHLTARVLPTVGDEPMQVCPYRNLEVGDSIAIRLCTYGVRDILR
jgi:hypothetical protein